MSRPKGPDEARHDVEGRTVASFGVIQEGKARDIGMDDFVKKSAGGQKIGVGPLIAGHSVVPRGRTPDTIYLFVYEGKLFLRVGKSVSLFDEDTRFSNGRFEVLATEEGVRVVAGAQTMVNLPLNQLVEDDRTRAAEVLASGSDNEEALVQLLEAVPTAVADVMAPEASPSVPPQRDPTVPLQPVSRDTSTGAWALIPEDGLKEISKSMTILDLGGTQEYTVDFQGIDTTEIKIEDLVGDHGRYTIVMREDSIQVLGSNGAPRATLNPKNNVHIVAGHFIAEFVAAKGSSKPLLKVTSANPTGIISHARVVRFERGGIQSVTGGYEIAGPRAVLPRAAVPTPPSVRSVVPASTPKPAAEAQPLDLQKNSGCLALPLQLLPEAWRERILAALKD